MFFLSKSIYKCRFYEIIRFYIWTIVSQHRNAKFRINHSNQKSIFQLINTLMIIGDLGIIAKRINSIQLVRFCEWMHWRRKKRTIIIFLGENGDQNQFLNNRTDYLGELTAKKHDFSYLKRKTIHAIKSASKIEEDRSF